eukprot:Rhum_TRINITY_DN14760_c1_g3::Rhum_TRINITY_DN14760_c1_g3_i1::g.115817::m.115817/K02943/RP-LP2, RPLP2; large subunit ribosomal protein LP2
MIQPTIIKATVSVLHCLNFSPDKLHKMRYIAAFLLAKINNDSPTEKDVKAVITAVGGEVDDARVTELFEQLKDKDIDELIEEGKAKLANCGGGGGAAAAAPAAGGAAPAEAAKAAPAAEPSEEDEDMGFGLFD